MANIGNGYGSECHLLRYLGRHRKTLDTRILSVIRGERIEWLDFGFDRTRSWGDAELKGLEFVTSRSVLDAWSAFWPQRGNAPNWDAIARIETANGPEWLLVEAKANTQEIISSCGASESGGRPTIVKALEKTKDMLGIPASRDWLNGYYQCANRIAVVNFLNEVGEPARLLFIYFIGDRNGSMTCPSDEGDWQTAIDAQNAHLGIRDGHLLSARVHKLFLDANIGDQVGSWDRRS